MFHGKAAETNAASISHPGRVDEAWCAVTRERGLGVVLARIAFLAGGLEPQIGVSQPVKFSIRRTLAAGEAVMLRFGQCPLAS